MRWIGPVSTMRCFLYSLVSPMEKDRFLVRTRGNRNGQCNICGEVGNLTEDHSPPKSCIKPTAVQVRHIVNLLANPEVQEKGRISQNGLKFRTLCARCNSQLLGKLYDPALSAFTTSVASVLESKLAFPRTLHIRGQPALIKRAIFGHLAAQGVERYLKGVHTETLRDAFLDPTKAFPENVRLYYWLFPHRGCILFRDAAIHDIPSGQTSVIWMMKFFPVSFLIAWEQTDEPMFDLPSLSGFPLRNPHDEVEIPIRLDTFPPRYWPEAPTDRTLLVYGQEAVFSVQHIASGRADG